MYKYKCHICEGACDAGELENGVCYDCRMEAAEAAEARRLKMMSELNQVIRMRYKQQSDGQMVMDYGR